LRGRGSATLPGHAWFGRALTELAIPEPRIGAYDIDFDFRHAAFFPKETSGGANSPGARINLNSGILNPQLLAPKLGPGVATLRAKGRLRDRKDGVIAHEVAEEFALQLQKETGCVLADREHSQVIEPDQLQGLNRQATAAGEARGR